MNRITHTLILLAAITLIAGCKSTTKVQYTNARPMPPAPTPAKVVPRSAKANTMALMVDGRPTDTDGNGYPDMIVALMYLFSLPHTSPMFEDGTFIFSLRYEDGTATQDLPDIAQWKLSSSEIERGQNLYGPVHIARLSLLETGGDRIPAMSANLICRFEPADGGEAVRPSGVHWIQLGKTRAASR